ncbi:hypothetical protein [Brevibacillus sp. Leaf182]|uniref:hypothetical protein n=1 Tax=Brevibacillus sp. Leaf182 TaxID=1736290 RepID=UPI000B012CD2|nr:hypothetical protein [Brevibacillus sp. Leaf182]
MVQTGCKQVSFGRSLCSQLSAGYRLETETVIASQRVYHDSQYPSHIKLPLLQSGGSK